MSVKMVGKNEGVVRFGIAVTLLLGGFLLTILPHSRSSIPSDWLHITLDGRTVHNSHYFSMRFLYQLQTLLGTEEFSPKVMQSKIVRRHGKELYIDLTQVSPEKASVLRQIARQQQPAGDRPQSNPNARAAMIK